MKTSVVAGGAGFLGSHLVDNLVDRGDEVVVVDNLATGQLANLERALLSGRVTFVFGDVEGGTDALRTALHERHVSRIDAIYDFASSRSNDPPRTGSFDMVEAGCSGTAGLIDVAVDYGAKFIFSSASSVDSRLLVDGTPGNSTDTFANNWKTDVDRKGEAAVAKAVANRNLNARIVRFYNCYGPRMRSDNSHLVPALFHAITEQRPIPIMGTSDEARPMVYVADAIKLVLLVADVRGPTAVPINVGSDDDSSVIDIASVLSRRLGINALPTFVPQSLVETHQAPDLTRARALGWMSDTSLERGLRLTCDWFALQSQNFI